MAARTTHTPEIRDTGAPIEHIVDGYYTNKRDALSAARKSGGHVYREESQNGPGWVYFVTDGQEDVEGTD